jgi:hypothetical protein
VASPGGIDKHPGHSVLPPRQPRRTRELGRPRFGVPVADHLITSRQIDRERSVKDWALPRFDAITGPPSTVSLFIAL